MPEAEEGRYAAMIEIRQEPPAGFDAAWCLNQYFHDLAERFETGFDPAKSNPASVMDMTPPTGFLLIARLDGNPVGCGVLKRKNATTGEIKRMWTAPAARGKGVARGVLRKLEAIARDCGLAILQLETNRALKEAQAFYRSEGYREVAAFNDEPYAHHWFEKRL